VSGAMFTLLQPISAHIQDLIDNQTEFSLNSHLGTLRSMPPARSHR
jgi:hypothetical protein